MIKDLIFIFFQIRDAVQKNINETWQACRKERFENGWTMKSKQEAEAEWAAIVFDHF